MAALSNYLENKLIDHVLRNTAYTTPGTSIYLSLHTGSPGEANDGANEVSGGSYARQQVSAWDAPSNGVTQNTNVIEFPEATGSWGTITHVGIYDASTSGNLLFHGAANSSVAIASGDIYRIKIGNLTVTFQ